MSNAQNNNNIDNQKAINTQNIAVMKQNAIDSFSKLVNEVRSAVADKRKATNLKDIDKTRVLIYYNFFVKRGKEFNKTIFWITCILTFLINMSIIETPVFENIFLNELLQSFCIFVIPSFSILFLQAENNIENFFYDLYNFWNVDEKQKIALKLQNFIFNDFQKKQHGYKKIITMSIVLVIFCAIFEFFIYSKIETVNFNLINIGFAFFCIFLMIHKKTNNVIKYI